MTSEASVATAVFVMLGFMTPSWQRKFARADLHLESLLQLVMEFMSARPYQAVEQVDEGTDPEGNAAIWHTFTGRIQQTPPAEWSPIIGDCLNNLRSSLDHLAWGLAGAQGDKTAFPIFRSQQSYERLTPSRHLQHIAPDAAALIESMQPYNHVEGYEAHNLYVLDRITNDDKHRELLGTHVGVAHIDIGNPEGDPAKGDRLAFEILAPPQSLFADGTTLLRYWTSNPNIVVPVGFAFDVALNPEGPTRGRPLLNCVYGLALAVSLVLREFELRFFAGVPLTPLPLEGKVRPLLVAEGPERIVVGDS